MRIKEMITKYKMYFFINSPNYDDSRKEMGNSKENMHVDIGAERLNTITDGS